MAYDLNFIVKSEGLLKFADSRVHFKIVITSKAVLDRDVTTGR